MIGVICENSFGFSKRGKCWNCGEVHNKEIIIGDVKYIKLCDKCYMELKKRMKAID